MEWTSDSNRCTYVSDGDIKVDCRKNRGHDFFFPLGNYCGISIVMDLESGDNGIIHLIDDYSVDLNELKEKFSVGEKYFIIQAKDKLEQLFTEFYDLPKRHRKTYLKAKIIELFLLLEELDVPSVSEERSYYYKSQVDKIREMVRLQVEDFTVWYTLEDLSKMFDFPLTGMKQCFKAIYGTSMADYMKTCRMNAAGQMLAETQKSVIEIATSVGYENPGQFSAAFKSKKGMNPSAYRHALIK